MKKIIVVFFLIYSSVIYSQNYGNLQGNTQLNYQTFQEDSTIGALQHPASTSGYTNLLYTNKKFIHGQPVCLGFILGCLLHEKLDDRFIDFFKTIDFNFTPEAMNINWNDVEKTLSTLKEYVEKTGLWYGIANDFEYTQVILDKFKGIITDLHKS